MSGFLGNGVRVEKHPNKSVPKVLTPLEALFIVEASQRTAGAHGRALRFA